ncbi:aldehyde dehydrogenase family protein [Alkalibacillus almallahensis]|uniref:aldehyde dehydrogenase family protein n=1 Tax=Alkalibacillus almallahensis TaxID=1379154 RepID=UPI001421E13E|nr:aldehyde dehydrogenase family protein [Alkalibacillus almallahensis]NIK12061.1 acyl-CoA reductase-like NAD-dependent aldehyde dehydrogenase [Alkalibacillus almallahensis]
MLQYQPYLDQLANHTTESQALVNPHTKEEIARMPICKEEQMEKAIKQADEAFKTIKNMPAHERSDILNRASDILQENKQMVAETIAQEAAKPMKYALAEVDRTVQTLKFSSVEARKLEGESIPMDAAPNGAGRDAYTIFEPIGVIGAITPFNFPLNLVVHKVGPAIASGNTVIVKPAEKTPLSAILLREALVQAGLPEDAYHVVPGEGKVLGDVLLKSDAVQKITFTGSPPVGREIKSNAGLKKVTLELGNNSALYVDKSMNDRMDDVVPKAVHGSYAYNGQVCISTQRIYVHEDIADIFAEQFVKGAEQLTFGDPLDEETDVCNLIDESSQQTLLEWIEDAEQQGAKVLTGGKAKDNGIAPTVLTDVPEGAKIMKEEAFGPVVIINRVASGDEALIAMNNSQYGLSAGLFSNDMKQAIDMAHGLEVGQVLVNDVPTLRFDHMPYGGRKQSGYGYEGVKYAIHEMVNRKMISLNYRF